MKKYIIVICSFIALAVMQGCSSGESKENNSASGIPVTATFLLKKDKISTGFQLPGELTSNREVDLYAKVTSFVKELKVDIGSEVKAGQLLITLDAPELISQLSEASSKLQSLDAIYKASAANYDRLTETSKTPGTISQNDLDNAIAKKNSDYANLEAAKSAYKEIGQIKDYLEIRAPFDGIITSRNVNLGAYVGPEGKGSALPLLTLQEQDHLRLVVSVPEAFTGYLKSGDEVGFTVKSSPNDTFKANVKRIAGALDLHLRSERIEMDVINTDRKLLPGMVAEVAFSLTPADSSFVIPKTALVNSNEGIYVIEVVGNKTKRIAVKKGRELKGRIEVFGPLAMNDSLITNSNEEIKDGTEVRTK